MAKVVGLECVRCGTLYPPEHYAEDCPKCRQEASSNLAVVYDASMRKPREKPTPTLGNSLWRYGDVLPVDKGAAASLREGGPPLHSIRRTGREIGLPNLFAKDET